MATTVIAGCSYCIGFNSKKEPRLCGWPAEAIYKVSSVLGSVCMSLCSKHADALQKSKPHWKLLRFEL